MAASLPDPKQLTDAQLFPFFQEYMRRVSVTGGRPAKLEPCESCGTPLTARQRREPCAICGHRHKRVIASLNAKQSGCTK